MKKNDIVNVYLYGMFYFTNRDKMKFVVLSYFKMRGLGNCLYCQCSASWLSKKPMMNGDDFYDFLMLHRDDWKNGSDMISDFLRFKKEELHGKTI